MSDSNNHPEAVSNSRGQSGVATLTSAAEVNDYLKHMRERDPQELLGVDAQSGLVRATIQATVISVIALAALTVGPYWWEKLTPPSKPAEQARETPKAENKDVATKSEPTKPATPEPAKTAENKKEPVSKDALDKLGVNESKTASPKVNPLEKSSDDLLKELDKK